MAETFAALTVRELDAQADEFEDLVVRGMREVMRQAIDYALRAEGVIVAAAGDEPPDDPQGFIAFIIQLWQDFVDAVLLPFLARSMEGTSAEQLSGYVNAFFGATLTAQEAAYADAFVNQRLDTERYLAQARNRLVGVGDVLWEDARQELSTGINEGDSVDQLAKRVMGAVGVAEPRARTIARTESNSAANAIVDQTNRSVSSMFGVTGGIRKEWSATHDLRTRPSHVAADGQVVEVDAPFTVGNASLQFPADPAGPPGETINCRCTTLTVISDEVIIMANDALGAFEADESGALTAAANQEEEVPYDIVRGGGDCADSEWAVVKQGSGESVGCHDTEESAQAQVAAIMASEDADESAAPTGASASTSGFQVTPVEQPVETSSDDSGRFVPWSGVIALEGTPTGDGREFAHGALTWAELPVPLGWMYERSHGGMPTDKVTNVGMIDTIERGEGGLIVATGRIDLMTERGWSVAQMMGTRQDPGSLAGISIDADDPDDPQGMNVEYVFPEECPLTESGAPDLDAAYEEGDDLDLKCMMPSKMVFHSGRIRAATLVDIPAFVEARIFLDEPLDDDNENELHDVVPVEDGEDDVIVAAAYTMTLHDIPPASWFDEPTDEPEIGAITVTDEGRIFGYLAPAHVAHRGIRNKRVEVPMKNVDYGIWMNRATIADDGHGGFTRVATGPITMDCGHAPMSNRVTGAARRAHYDNSCSVVATARVGENSRGVWIAGALLPDVTPEQVRRMMALQLSGDWGPHREKPGKRELAGALLVPVPGYPKRSFSTMSIRNGFIQRVTVPLRFARTVSRDVTKTFGVREAADRIARSVGLDRESRVHKMAQKVKGE